jgi:transcriptional regulator with XRE-family HTH domain
MDATTKESVGFSSNLRYYRQLRGWSVPQLALKSGLHRTTVFRYERGLIRPIAMSVQRLARALDVGVEKLMV